VHELGLTVEIVEIVCVHAQGARVKWVELQIGKLSAVLPDAVRFAFGLCVEGTVAEGARLDILETRAKARCRVCEMIFELDQPFGTCPCGSANLEWLAGHELKVTQMEVEDV